MLVHLVGQVLAVAVHDQLVRARLRQERADELARVVRAVVAVVAVSVATALVGRPGALALCHVAGPVGVGGAVHVNLALGAVGQREGHALPLLTVPACADGVSAHVLALGRVRTGLGQLVAEGLLGLAHLLDGAVVAAVLHRGRVLKVLELGVPGRHLLDLQGRGLLGLLPRLLLARSGVGAVEQEDAVAFHQRRRLGDEGGLVLEVVVDVVDHVHPGEALVARPVVVGFVEGAGLVEVQDPVLVVLGDVGQTVERGGWSATGQHRAGTDEQGQDERDEERDATLHGTLLGSW